MVQKFVMGSPLYRQEQEWNRQGVKTFPTDYVELDIARGRRLAKAGV